MPLTEKQIETLFAFTIEQGVNYYDLQVELVDHLASGIEEEMNNNALLTPYDALQKVYNSFGQSGFTDVIKERQNALEKSNRKLWWRMLKSHFIPPKLFVTAVVFAIAFFLSPYLSGATQGFIIQGIVLDFRFCNCLSF